MKIHCTITGRVGERTSTLMEQLENALIKAIENAGGYVEKGVDFAIEQSPSIIDQLIRWQLIKGTIWMVMSVVLSLIILGISRRMYRYDPGDKHCDPIAISWFIFVAGNIGSSIIFVINALWVIKICVAPKVWLIEYAASLVKK